MPRPFIAGNWKMHKTVSEALEFVGTLARRFPLPQERDIAIAAPYTALHSLGQALRGTTIGLAAQNVHWEEKGAFTGEVSARMLCEAGCRYVIAGHSERRRLFGEKNRDINLKVRAALAAGLKPILCVGETLEERGAEETFRVVRRQLKEGLNNLTPDDIRRVIVAYEPVWAIGTGKTAAPAQAQEVHRFIRQLLAGLGGEDIAAATPIIYGGSVTPGNIKDLMAETDIDGVLVGGASLDVESFSKIIQF
ncbi:MAG TPA: triose-phosphate isomerase [Syntrophales bacterium]|nr:triose-phosphate isomerase [Syntrophales bacterium]HOX95504.1 triose-phosphate isomerase [Syntrophales bacterium]HPI58020.1 triose-phosphate isomerase [Syntrophales bacterium]HPN25236.1 triose-phosphate isomerase [Syntrophales bacterium]HQM29345.1 triose-phosphate isomerase [Syntrophales bacterium]